ncbi:MAG: hypothetical protein Q9161_001270 [Pseudevernia consocians]
MRSLGPYIYSRLEAPRQHIRLVDLLPGNSQDEITCELQVVALSDKPRFEALSYVWGDPEVTLPIVVGSHSLHVTTNLHSALQHLRQPLEPRWFWIDAICINQADIAEKTHQVNLMKEIYRGAVQGLVWLGDFVFEGLTEVEAEGAFGSIRMIASDCHEVKTPPAQPGESTLLAQSGCALECAMRLVVPHMDNSGSRSSSLDYYFMGSVSTSWDSFEKAAEILARDRDNGSTYISELPSILQGHHFTGPVMGIKYMRENYDQARLDIVWRFRYRVASDPRDKVFGLFGLMPDASPSKLRESDYALDTANLYQRVAIDCVESNNGLACMIGRRGEPRVCQALPSWAVDWVRPLDPRQRSSRYWDHAFRYQWFCCDNGMAVSMHTHDGTSSISLDGIHMDTIKVMGQATIMNETVVDEDLSVEDLRATITRWHKVASSCQPSDGMYVGGGTWHDAFWRTLIGDLITDDSQPRRKANLEDHQSFTAFCDLRNAEPKSSEVYDSLRSFLVNQSFIVTQRGHMGIGPRDLEVGDEVWVLFGSRVPFVLRPIAACQTKNSPVTFTLVGDCYVHGCMEGEAMVGLKGEKKTVLLY